jgi:uncharacterized membrane protein YfcA
MLSALLIFLLTGALAGLLLGMLGVGCGLIIVPILAFWLPRHGVHPALVMQMAITTSLLIIIITCLASLRIHYRNGNIKWIIIRYAWAGIVLGAALGAILVHYFNTETLKLIFGIFIIYIAVYLFIKLWQPIIIQPTDTKIILFRKSILVSIMTCIAFISSLVGIGGGSFMVPFFRYMQLSMLEAVATSTACAFLVALIGALTMIIASLHAQYLPAWSLGYLYWPAFLCIATTSLIFAPIGIKLTNYINPNVLQIALASCLLLAGGKMLWSAL